MRKLIFVVVAVIMCSLLVTPAVFAQPDPPSTDVGTTVTISSGGGEIPIVKCKWEQEPIQDLESGDLPHLIDTSNSSANSQFLPPLAKCAQKPIEYFAVVTDEEDMGDVYEVFAIVYHPINSPPPYNQSDNQIWGTFFKYKVVFTNEGHDLAARQTVLDAYDAGLITFDPGYDIDEITNGTDGEMEKGTANLWRGEEMIDYEQPAGFYTVAVYAVDNNNNMSTPLANFFEYVAVSGIEVDFSSINYGGVNLNQEKLIPGDITWNVPLDAAPDPNPATVRNVGNTWAHVTVMQTAMGFGTAGALPGTALSGPSPAALAGSNWNVTFDARMGNDPAYEMWYDPFVTVELPNYLGLSCQDELDFSINVNNGFATRAGDMTLSSTIEPFHPGGTPVCYPSPCTS